MVCSSCLYPAFKSCQKVRFCLPHYSCHRKIRHFKDRLHHMYILDNQSEPVSQVDKGSHHSISCLPAEDQPCRILSVADSQWMDFNSWLIASNGRANFKHMGAETRFITFLQVICVILHEGRFPILSHGLADGKHCRCLPVSFCTKAEAGCHQILGSQSR